MPQVALGDWLMSQFHTFAHQLSRIQGRHVFVFWWVGWGWLLGVGVRVCWREWGRVGRGSRGGEGRSTSAAG